MILSIRHGQLRKLFQVVSPNIGVFSAALCRIAPVALPAASTSGHLITVSNQRGFQKHFKGVMPKNGRRKPAGRIMVKQQYRGSAGLFRRLAPKFCIARVFINPRHSNQSPTRLTSGAPIYRGLGPLFHLFVCRNAREPSSAGYSFYGCALLPSSGVWMNARFGQSSRAQE
jgi:hypothetical protein